jgi:hypothetical protein
LWTTGRPLRFPWLPHPRQVEPDSEVRTLAAAQVIPTANARLTDAHHFDLHAPENKPLLVNHKFGKQTKVPGKRLNLIGAFKPFIIPALGTFTATVHLDEKTYTREFRIREE